MRTAYVCNVDQRFVTNNDDSPTPIYGHNPPSAEDEIPLDPFGGWDKAESNDLPMFLHDESTLPPSFNWEPTQPKGKAIHSSSDDEPLDPNGGWY